MSLGDLTKQFAEQAINKQVKSVTDSLRGTPEPVDTGLGAVLLAQIQALQKSLKEEQDLFVTVHIGQETLRVVEIYAPSWPVWVLTAINSERQVVRVVAPAATLQLICKVVKLAPDTKPTRVNCIPPKPAA
ncbi:MAG TPA: hypothetical protein DEQ47_05025 [Solibacterales bacterium]|nr:hypothetical protein [Bryobacterales bacterium]